MALKREDVTPERRHLLNTGQAESTTLVEGLIIDFALLAKAAAPELKGAALDRLREAATLGIVARMALAGEVLHEALGEEAFARLSAHPSDTVRGWAGYLLARQEIPLTERIETFRPLADDRHFGVREWAWMALRPFIAADLETAIIAFEPWTREASANLRRFAPEITRPRGVWTKMIPALVKEPWRGLPLLEPLKSDESKYVRDSVANWLNDAAKSQPEWVEELCAEWEREAEKKGDANGKYVVKRAMRWRK